MAITHWNPPPHLERFFLIYSSLCKEILEHCYGLPSLWFFPSRFDMLLHAVLQPWVSLCRHPVHHKRIHPLVNYSAPLIIHWSVLISKALKSPRRHSIHSFPVSPRKLLPPRALQTSTYRYDRWPRVEFIMCVCVWMSLSLD